MNQHRVRTARLLACIILLGCIPCGRAQVVRTVGTLQPGQTCTITFDVVINTNFPLNTFSVTNQGSVTGTGFGPILTDDPTVGGASDPTVTLLPAELDFGDAPNPFPTLLASNGARHVIPFTGPTLFLGAIPPDAETNGQPNAGSTGDNIAGANDEDGVTLPSVFTRSTGSNITIIASAPGLLSAWIDWNLNGDWNGAGEQVLASAAVSAGANVFSIVAPTSAVAGASSARFRLSTQAGLGTTGQALDGEVEDYAVTFTVTSVSTNAEQRKILALEFATNGFLVTFAGIAGQTGFVQAADVIFGPWTNVSPPIIMNGTSVTNYLNLTNAPQLFYRATQ